MNILNNGTRVVLKNTFSKEITGTVVGYTVMYRDNNVKPVYLVDLDDQYCSYLENQQGFITTLVVHPDNLHSVN